MFSGYTDWILLAVMILVSDLLLWRAAYLAGRRRPLSAVEVASTDEPEKLEEQLADPAEEIHEPAVARSEITRELSRLDSRLCEMHEILRRLSDDASSQSSGTASQADGVLDFAARLAQRGCGVDELVDLCNLGRSEAELVHALHAERSSATA